MNTAHDNRTCSACGAPIASFLRGFMESIRACNKHLITWGKSRECFNAKMDSMCGRGDYGRAFEEWAKCQR